MGIALSALSLSGCQQSNGDGTFQKVFVNPFISSLDGLAGILGDNYGFAIIIVTIIIRLIIMPFMLKQQKKQQEMKVKMALAKPEIEEIQRKLKEATNLEEKQKIQADMMKVYQKHEINPLNIGCLPLLIQMPFLMGLYYAITSSEEIATHSFLWFSLGQPDLFVTAIAGILYFVQFKVSQSAMPIEQQKQTRFIGLLSPIMIVIFSINAPAALPLYWSVGGLCLILQVLLGQRLYPPQIMQPETKG
ncbi:membrane protein insertase YidC [Solibacillus sp. Sa1YVA6]|uniref:Membrane protein insertase YidC n=2 Tax=Caryophanaceae TaxID=186818 RepID=A0ABR8XN24_9BACL|nr:membrane protein insertase YidC [Solibacillus merdavium]